VGKGIGPKNRAGKKTKWNRETKNISAKSNQAMKTKTESNRNVEWGKNPKHRRADGEQNWKHKSGQVE